MYTTYFGLKEIPFSITPDPAYLYMSPRHQEALGHLLYGTGQYGGFVQLTGEVGTGKTTIVRTLLAQKLPEVDLAMVLNPRQNETEFVASICDELHVSYPRESATLKTLVDALNAHLLEAHARGRRTVVIIDEAQNLQPEVLEQVRLLTNLETHKEKLLRIMLVGQPELSELLARPDLRQLAQRITARFHLTPLEPGETSDYIKHRLRVAGGSEHLFTPAALAAVHRHSRGVPRLINVICDRALLGAYGRGEKQITPELVRAAAAEVAGTAPRRSLLRDPRINRLTDAALVVLILAVLAAWLWPRAAPEPAAVPVAVAAAPLEPAPVAQTPPVGGLEQLLQATEPLPTVLARLVQLWSGNPQPQAGEPLCRALSREGLECLRATGTRKDLEIFNRPAVLILSTGRGATQYTLLRRLSGRRATLDTAAGPVELDADTLGLVWTGEFLLLWRRETPGRYIPQDASGPAVLWLRERLEKADGQALVASEPDRFDPQLRDALTRFQSVRGLVADGFAGVRTLIALSDIAPPPGTPTLQGAN